MRVLPPGVCVSLPEPQLPGVRVSPPESPLGVRVLPPGMRVLPPESPLGVRVSPPGMRVSPPGSLLLDWLPRAVAKSLTDSEPTNLEAAKSPVDE